MTTQTADPTGMAETPAHGLDLSGATAVAPHPPVQPADSSHSASIVQSASTPQAATAVQAAFPVEAASTVHAATAMQAVSTPQAATAVHAALPVQSVSAVQATLPVQSVSTPQAATAVQAALPVQPASAVQPEATVQAATVTQRAPGVRAGTEGRPAAGGQRAATGRAPAADPTETEGRRAGTPRWAAAAGRVGASGQAAVSARTAARVPSTLAPQTPADPVRVLMHRHRELCERAVDPLEIAAGLEAHGVTDRTAARFRHRDVFSLAEELYARVPRTDEEDATANAPELPARDGSLPTGWAAYALLPGALCALTLLGADRAAGGLRVALLVTGALATALALLLCLRHGPLRADGHTPWARTGWLLLYAVLGDGVLTRLLGDGPLWTPAPAALLGLAAALAPAAWCARLLTVQARRRLAVSRGTEDFGSAVRPLLFGVFGLYAAALTVLLYGASRLGIGGGFAVSALAVGALLFLARLLAVHGLPDAGSMGLTFACAAEATLLGSVLASRLPGCEALAGPVRHAVREWGAGAVPAFACGAAALGLLAHAAVALSQASAHAVTSASAVGTARAGRRG
ncbi:hypothetical protein ACQPZG_12080 [Streptomyces sp. CA-294286]|uniref:hypothetical protein n=1 Tax=Streptomyces sp. CA-294286 TaxID=3240070 RepID=UPI003D8CE1C3